MDQFVIREIDQYNAGFQSMLIFRTFVQGFIS